jgi:hypothetical protein
MDISDTIAPLESYVIDGETLIDLQILTSELLDHAPRNPVVVDRLLFTFGKRLDVIFQQTQTIGDFIADAESLAKALKEGAQ